MVLEELSRREDGLERVVVGTWVMVSYLDVGFGVGSEFVLDFGFYMFEIKYRVIVYLVCGFGRCIGFGC